MKFIVKSTFVFLLLFQVGITLATAQLPSPNDTAYQNGQQYWYENIKAAEALDLAKNHLAVDSTNPVIVAIFDSGIDIDHPDIAQGSDNYTNLWLNAGESGAMATDSIDNDGNGYIDDHRGWDFAYGNNNIDDKWGHGTPIAGIIGAKTNNTTGISSIGDVFGQQAVKIMPVNVSDSTGNFSSLVLADANIF